MKYAFTTVLNDLYLSGFLLTVNSILRNSPNFCYDIVIYEWGELSDESKNVIKKLYDKVIFKKVKTELYQNHKFDENFRKWTYNCNYRFDVFTLCEYEKILFFDCDIIFRLDVSDILNYDVDFGACSLDHERVVQTDNIDKCFDAGLMLIGKKYLNENVRDELIQEANKPAPNIPGFNANCWLSDEPILNNYFKNKIYILPQKYNTIVSEINNNILKHKINLQYTGDKKPWNSNVLEEQFSEFTIQSIKKEKKIFLQKLIFRKLTNIVKNEIFYLKQKNINIEKYFKNFYE